MPAQFDLIVFDWDGTLLDSAAAIVHAIQHACVDIGVPPPDDATARSVIGLGLIDALARAVPSLPVSTGSERSVLCPLCTRTPRTVTLPSTSTLWPP